MLFWDSAQPQYSITKYENMGNSWLCIYVIHGWQNFWEMPLGAWKTRLLKQRWSSIAICNEFLLRVVYILRADYDQKFPITHQWIFQQTSSKIQHLLLQNVDYQNNYVHVSTPTFSSTLDWYFNMQCISYILMMLKLCSNTGIFPCYFYFVA